MLRIQKGPPPACIAELHRTPGATWQSVSGEQKDAMRRGLLAEQGHLCAYCMGRITNDRARCTVEHWRPRSDPPRGLRRRLRQTPDRAALRRLPR